MSQFLGGGGGGGGFLPTLKQGNTFFVKRDFCCFDFLSNILVLFCKISGRKDDKSFKRRICCLNFHSILYRFNDLLYRLNDIISRLNEMFVVLIAILYFCCFNFCSGEYLERLRIYITGIFFPRCLCRICACIVTFTKYLLIF